MSQYNDEISKLKNLAFIHVSSDRDETAAEKWAEKEKFPWLTILPGDGDREDIKSYNTKGFVPNMTLLKADGSVVTEGYSAALSALSNLK